MPHICHTIKYILVHSNMIVIVECDMIMIVKYILA